MAQVVLIAEGTYRSGLNYLGDIVAIHDDGTVPHNCAYSTFKVVEVPGFTREELQQIIQEKWPDIVEDNTGQEVAWWDNAEGEWKQCVKIPKYKFSAAGLTAQQITDLANPVVKKKDKTAVINAVVIETMSREQENQQPLLSS